MMLEISQLFNNYVSALASNKAIQQKWKRLFFSKQVDNPGGVG